MKPLRGVNLGGWLVLEPWLTPGLFDGTDAADEYSYCQQMDSAGLRRLREHYRTFITEQDFAWLSEHGIDAVRLPVGYWLFGDVAPYQATFPYVDKTLVWAEKYGLKVLIDLHGAPGSQNGQMHSGRRGDTNWPLANNVSQTLRILERLAKQYGQHPALLGISLLNEPSAQIPRRQLESFYDQTYQMLRPLCKTGAWLVFSDNYRPRRWYHRLPTKQYPGLLIDYHHYQIFDWADKILPARWQVWRARHLLPRKLRRMARYHPLVVGEWSLALRSEKMAVVPDKKRDELLKEFATAQLCALQVSQAWFYWSYKTQSTSPWDFKRYATRFIDVPN